MKSLICVSATSWLLAVVFPTLAFAQVNVLTYHNDTSRTGQNLNETILTPSNVSTNTFGKLFSYTVDGFVYAQPLYVSGLAIPGQGTHNVVFVATEHNSVYAFDADSNAGVAGGLLWQTNLGPSAATPNNDFGTRYNGGQYGDILPEAGITGTPVIDTDSGTLYVDALTHEGTSYFHRIHALNITNGTERTYSPGLVAAAIPGTGVGGNGSVVTFNPEQHLQRGALTLAGGILYVPYTGYADTDPYHGWILGFNPGTLQLLTNSIFNTTPNSRTGTFGPNAGEGGIWMGGNGIAVDVGTNLYFEVANGSFNATNGTGGTEYGDSFMKLSSSNGLAVADYFTPYDQATMASKDLDLGSGGLTLIPDQPGPYPHLLVGAGKQSKIYLINRDLMTTGNNHFDSTGTVDSVVQTVSGQITGSFGTPAYFNGRIYYGGTKDKLKAFALSNGALSSTPVSTGPRTFSAPGATPSVSANGTNNGIVWALQAGSPAVLAAYYPTNLTTEMYSSDQAAANRDQLANGVKFAVPTIANGKVYVGNQYSVAVFGLLDPYLNWEYAHFGANATNPAVAGDLADPDGDGVPNLLEYALATDPQAANTNNSITGAISAGHFQVQFDRNTSATDMTYVVQVTATLGGTWTDLLTYASATGWVLNTGEATVLESATTGVPPDQYVSVMIDLGPPGQSSQFLRLSVHR